MTAKAFISPEELHPLFIRKEGKEEYAILPAEEYHRLQESLEDALDLLLLQEAREQDDPSIPSLSHEELKRELGLE